MGRHFRWHLLLLCIQEAADAVERAGFAEDDHAFEHGGDMVLSVMMARRSMKFSLTYQDFSLRRF